MNVHPTPDAVVRLRTDDVAVTVLPALGGKIVSITDERTRSEWLYQNPRPRRPVEVTRHFGPEVAYGFDDMFPTIIEEYQNRDVGTYPDHGDLWRGPCAVEERTDTRLVTVRHGGRIPYTFRRDIEVDGPRITVRYEVSNRSSHALPALWAAHPLFSYGADTRLIVPETVRSIVQATDGGALGPYGTIHTVGSDRVDIADLYRLGTLERGTAYKFYGADPVVDGYCGLVDRRGTLTIRYAPAALPWLGFWINNGGWGGQRNVALEPATSPMDGPQASTRWGVSASWRAGETRRWELVIELEGPS